MFPEFESAEFVSPPGLKYQEEFLTFGEEEALIVWIDAQPWETELSRRRQFYGGTQPSSGEPGTLPNILSELAERLCLENLVSVLPDRCLINEYLPGQGIAAHVDLHPEFGAEVVIISLLSTYPMLFARSATGQSCEKWLPRRSVCMLTGESRYEWTHEIVKRKADLVVGGGRQMRGRRISVTFRKKILGNS